MEAPRIDRILVPVDFSEMTGAVIDNACFLANKFEASLTLLHVVHVPPLAEASTWLDPVVSPSVEQDIRVQMEEGAKKQLEGMKEKCSNSGLRVDYAIKVGEPFDEIVRMAGELDSDLIVMGTHGRSGFSHLIIGSVAERVLRRAPCSVFCINPRVAGEEG